MQYIVYFNIKLDANYHKFRPLFQKYGKCMILNELLQFELATDVGYKEFFFNRATKFCVSYKTGVTNSYLSRNKNVLSPNSVCWNYSDVIYGVGSREYFLLSPINVCAGKCHTKKPRGVYTCILHCKEIHVACGQVRLMFPDGFFFK